MRLAYLTPQYPKISHTFVRREIRALEALGHEILRLSIRPPDQDVVDPIDREERARTICCLEASPWALLAALVRVALTQPRRFASGLRLTFELGLRSERGLGRHLAYLVEAAFFVRVLRERDLHHLHVHFGTNAASVALIMRRLGGPPFSLTIHGSDEFDSPRGVSLAAKVEGAQFVAAVSQFTRAQIQRWVPTRAWSKIHVVHCTVDDAHFNAARPIDPDADGIACVARIDHQKGHPVLLEAFEALAHKGVQGSLVLVGDGDHREEIEQRIAASGLRDRVQITGWVDETKLRQIVLGARAVVLPSFTEGQPMVLMEALALARPVVATYVGGIPELIIPGENGWLVPAGDAEALAEALHDVYTRPVAELDAMGQAGRERVKQLHDGVTEAARLEQLFESALTPSPEVSHV